MSFNDQFYSIQSTTPTETGCSYSIRIDAAHAIFKGHFPGNPVTPGVMQLEIIKELVNRTKNETLALKTMGNCKFLAILNPEQDAEVDVHLTIKDGEEGETKVTAIIQNSVNAFLKMNATYQ